MATTKALHSRFARGVNFSTRRTMRLINSEVRFTHLVDGERVQRGYEQQRYVMRKDGTTTLTAFSYAANLGLTRDVIINLSAAMRPIDSYVRIHLGDRVEGAGWFRFGDEDVEADLWNIRKGLTKERLIAPGGAKAFGAHPICCDVLLAAAFDRNLGRIQSLENVFLSSAHHFGAEGPEIAPVRPQMEYVGVEKRTTLAGEFETDHWRILPGQSEGSAVHPQEDIWAMRDTLIFAHASLHPTGYEYDLTSFTDVQL